MRPHVVCPHKLSTVKYTVIDDRSWTFNVSITHCVGINNSLCMPFSQLPEEDYQNVIETLLKFSLIPRPSPDFSPRLRDKIWKGPGDEASRKSTFANYTVNAQDISLYTL